jgi:hypothetical protein
MLPPEICYIYPQKFVIQYFAQISYQRTELSQESCRIDQTSLIEAPKKAMWR